MAFGVNEREKALRRYIFGVILVCIATGAFAQDLRPLTPVEVDNGFQGLIACRAQHADGACNSVIVQVSVDGNRRVVQEIGLTSIAELISSASADEVRNMPLYDSYADLFSALEQQRAEGNFRYIKSVETATGVYRANAGGWCRRDSETSIFETVEFYFSNTTAASVDGDEALAPHLLFRLRSFLHDLVQDPGYQARSPQDQASRAGLEAMLGRRELCVQYTGIVQKGAVQVRGILIDSEGVPLTYHSTALRMLPADGDVRLAIN